VSESAETTMVEQASGIAMFRAWNILDMKKSLKITEFLTIFQLK
jgi:hypothetical protein